MNRRSFIAACCGAAVAPWVKSDDGDPVYVTDPENFGCRSLKLCTCESSCDKCRAKLLSSGMKRPVAIGPFRPEKFYSITKEIMA